MSTLKLRSLTAASNKMLASLIPLSTNSTLEKLKDDLEKLRRRCHVMSLLYDRNVISVAGLQGVGKSTMISNLYDYNSDDTPFLENQGQGETLPVLVSESEQPGRYFVHRVIEENGILKIKKEEIFGKEKFHSISHNYDRSDLLLEVTVPYKVFYDNSRSFLLLPGFQHGTDYLKELTFTALRSSSNCLVLFYQPKYAHKNNRELINTLTEEFSESSPIFVITWSDNENSNLELLKDVKNDLGIKEEDRVIRSGIPGPEGWKDSMINAMKNYGLPRVRMTEIQQKNIKLLVADYNNIIANIQIELRKLSVDKSNREYEQVDRIIKLMQEQRAKIKETLKVHLIEYYTKYFGRIEDAISKRIVETYKGWDGFTKSLSEFFTNNVEVRVEFNNLVNACIKESNVNTINGEYEIILNRIINEYMQHYNIVMNLPIEGNVHHDKKLLMCGYENQSQEISKTALNDIYLMLHPEKQDAKFSTDLQFNAKLVPLLALESFRINNIIAENSLSIYPVGALEEQQSLINMYQDNKREVAIGVGVLCGFDIMEGNGIDLFGLMQHNAVNGGAAMATATFNWAAASIAGAAMVVYMLDQLNKSVDKKDKTARLAIESMKNYTIEDILSKYDTNMQRYEDIVRDCLIRRYGLADEFAHIQNCHSVLLDLKRIKNEIEESNRVEI